MFSDFVYATLALKDISLDSRNPRLVTQLPLKTERQIVSYLFEHEDLADFIGKIIALGKNTGAERPYVIKNGNGYTVIEGNTRVAAYKLLAGQLKAPSKFAAYVPDLSKAVKDSLAYVDCSIAPSRDALPPIMANSHFGLGDKSRWGYLGSRKAVYDEWRTGKTVEQLASAFSRNKGEITELILEYQLYQKALKLNWTQSEKAKLLDPSVAFNPPVRFLQSKGHKEKVGVSYDSTNLQVNFVNPDAEQKFKHLVRKLVVHPQAGVGATASYEKVFDDFVQGAAPSSSTSGSAVTTSSAAAASKSTGPTSNKVGTLFSYACSVNNGLLKQLSKEAGDLNCKRYPAAGTFLLRNVTESLLKHIIDEQKANPAGKTLDLEGALNLCRSNAVNLSGTDKKILQEFLKTHLSYLNLGAHGNVIPNYDRLMAARDCIDLFIKKNI